VSKQILQPGVLIHEPMTLAGAARPGLRRAESVGLVVLLLEALPSAEQVLLRTTGWPISPTAPAPERSTLQPGCTMPIDPS
jgi:hypothetical protein